MSDDSILVVPESLSVFQFTPDLLGTDIQTQIVSSLAESPALAAQISQFQLSLADLEESQSRFQPRLSLGLNVLTALNGERSAALFANLAQLIFDGGASERRLAASQIRILQARYNVLVFASELTQSHVEAWYQVLLANENTSISQDSVAAHTNYVALVQERMEAGADSNVEVDFAVSRLAEAEAQLSEAVFAERNAEANFVSIFGYSPNQLSTPPEAPEFPSVAPQSIIIDNPAIRGLDADIAALRIVRDAIIADQFPIVDFQLALGLDLNGNLTASAGAEPEIDVLSSGARGAAISRINAQIEAKSAAREGLVRDITRSLTAIRFEQNAGRDRLAAAIRALSAANRAVATSREQFLIGRVSVRQLLEVQQDQFEAAMRVATAKSQIGISGYAILALTGDILDVFAIRDLLP